MKHAILAAMMLCAVTGSAEAPALEAFSPGEKPGEYRIETEHLRGILGLGGFSVGLHPLAWKETQERVSGPMGLFNYYRIFTTNHRHVESMRALPSETHQEGPDTVRVHWEASESLPFSLTALYRWTAPDTLDLETIVEAKVTLPDFDVFLASYLSPAFPVSTVYVKTEDNHAEFMNVEKEDGVWHVFPRDAAAVDRVKDGRWDIEPSPVDWVVRPEFAAPLMYRRHESSGLTVVTMARPEDCFALFAPFRGEAHYSMYFSLIGRTLEAGETVRNRVRLIIGDLDDAEILKRYAEFLK